MDDAKALQERWSEELSRKLNSEITLIKKRGKPKPSLPASPFPDTDAGLSDYRGFPLESQLHGFKIANIDFSCLVYVWGGSLDYCDVEKSRFVRANFDGCFLGERFIDCNFNRASFKKSSLGDIFSDCTFIGANLSSAMTRGTKFIRCSFDQANMKRAHFFSCLFDNCSFEGTRFRNGSLAGCTFLASQPSEEQLENTILNYVKFESDCKEGEKEYGTPSKAEARFNKTEKVITENAQEVMRGKIKISPGYVSLFWAYLGKGLDIDEYLFSINLNNASSIKKLVEDYLLPLTKEQSITHQIRTKESFRYAINFYDEETLIDLYEDWLPQIELPTQIGVKDFYVSVWKQLYSNEDYSIQNPNVYEILSEFDVYKPQ